MSHYDHPIASTNTPIACSLAPLELAKRKDELQETMASFEVMRELPDGYALQYPAHVVQKLVQFIVQERACCPFFTFELVFEPAEGPLWLRIYGPEGVKPFIKDMFSIKED